MATARIYDKNGSERGTVELPANLFDVEVNGPVLHQSVVAYLANQRQGTSKTKERSDVRGGGRKPFRQKGTGRARQGTIRSPIHRGGGVVFGPHPRDYRQALPKKVRRLALRSALTSRARDEAIIVVDDLRYSEPKTKQFVELLKGLGNYRDKVLLVLDKPNAHVYKSARNIEGVHITLAHMINPYELLWASRIILTESALRVVEEVFK
ncbi:MAG: 50S ribosomal protein L4 [bacterium]|nr:50S ribosomal protein L4 [bacterium]